MTAAESGVYEYLPKPFDLTELFHSWSSDCLG